MLARSVSSVWPTVIGSASVSSTRSATSAASWRSLLSSSSTRELVAAEAGGRVARADARLEALGDLDQHLVAGGVAEAVVDHLEVVEVHEDDGDDAVLAARARQRVADALAEQRAVGEPRDGVVERLVGQLLLEGPALAHVAAVEDDPADVLVVEQVGVQDLEVAGGAVAVTSVHSIACWRLGTAASSASTSCRRVRSEAATRSVEAPAGDLVGRVAEQPLDRRALVGDVPSRATTVIRSLAWRTREPRRASP